MPRPWSGRKVKAVSLLSQFARRSPGPPIDVVPPPSLVARASTGTVAGGVLSIDVAHQLARTLLSAQGTDELDLARLEAAVDEGVDVWTPAVRLSSRFELISMLTEGDDTIDEIDVVFTDASATERKMFLEWTVTGRFAGPAFTDDDELIEPTGGVLAVGGITRLSFATGVRITRICCYYDRLALLEQMLDPSSSFTRERGKL